MYEWPETSKLMKLMHDPLTPQVVTWDLPGFLAEYTLHDSGLAEVRYAPWDGMLVLIDWDLHWNRRVGRGCHNLVIAIRRVYSAKWREGGWHQSTLSGATSSRVPEDERCRMLEDGSLELRAYQNARDEIPPPFEDAGLTRTTFEMMNWGLLSVLHGNEVRFACLDDGGNTGELPRGA
jgi:hypothetical protein